MAVDGFWVSLSGALTLTSNGNSISGTYQQPSAAPLPLVGWINNTNDPSLGWTALAVGGGNDVTSWAGQYYADGNPPMIISFRLTQSVSTSGLPTVVTEIFERT